MANKLRVSKSGSGAPTNITPDFLGQIYIDEDTGTRYEATALTEGSWVDKLSLKENVANKKTDLTDNSDTYYPTQKAVKTAVDEKQDTLTFGIANTNAVKIDDASVADNDYAKFTANGIEGVPYSTVLSDIGAQAALGYTAENAANKVTSFQATPDDTHYASEKLVKDSLDTKAPTASPTFTGTVTLPKTIKIQDTSADHTYNLSVSELTANRTVTLPLLAGDDTFLFKDFHKATSAETNIGTEDNKYITPLGLKNSRLLKWRIGGNHSGNVVPELVGNTIISEYNIFATGNIVIKPPSVSGADYETGMKLLLNIESISNWNITWDTIYESNGLVLPRKCNSSIMYLTFIYQNNKWRLLSADPYVLASGLKEEKIVETSSDVGNELNPSGYHKENEFYVTALNRRGNIRPPYCPTEYPALNGNTLLIRIKDDGTPRELIWNSIYRAIGVALPATTTAGKTLYIGCKYNSADSKWDVLAVGQEA